MALSTCVATLTKKYFLSPALELVKGTIAIQGTPGTYAAGGLTLDLSNLFVGSFLNTVPVEVFIQGQGGFLYRYVAGTTLANGKVEVFCETTVATNAPLLEHTTTTTVAGVAADTITFVAFVQKFV